ncbi:hypothetical protein V6Z12_D08G159800 [Gossypium hirsutum]
MPNCGSLLYLIERYQMIHFYQKQGPHPDDQPTSSQRRSTVSDVAT